MRASLLHCMMPACSLPSPTLQLEPGKLLVMHPSGQSTEVSEADVQVVDRNFLVADLCRKAGRRGQAGVITKTDTEVQLMRVLSGEKIEGWFSADEVVGATRIVVSRVAPVSHRSVD